MSNVEDFDFVFFDNYSAAYKFGIGLYGCVKLLGLVQGCSHARHRFCPNLMKYTVSVQQMRCK